MPEPVRWYSHAMEGVPYGTRYPSLSFAIDAARKTLDAYPDIERVQIVELSLKSLEYVARQAALPAAGVDLFADIQVPKLGSIDL